MLGIDITTVLRTDHDVGPSVLWDKVAIKHRAIGMCLLLCANTHLYNPRFNCRQPPRSTSLASHICLLTLHDTRILKHFGTPVGNPFIRVTNNPIVLWGVIFFFIEKGAKLFVSLKSS